MVDTFLLGIDPLVFALALDFQIIDPLVFFVELRVFLVQVLGQALDGG